MAYAYHYDIFNDFQDINYFAYKYLSLFKHLYVSVVYLYIRIRLELKYNPNQLLKGNKLNKICTICLIGFVTFGFITLLFIRRIFTNKPIIGNG